jgi:hypothetical protein
VPSVRSEAALHFHVVSTDVLEELIPLALVGRAAEAEENNAYDAKPAQALHGNALLP